MGIFPGGLLPIMAYTGSFPPEGVPFQYSGIKKGKEIGHLGI